MTDDGVIDKSIASLGKGFDLTSDFRLKYCKGGDKRLVLINEDQKKQLFVPGFGTLKQPVSVDIKCDKGELTRHQSDILEFNQVHIYYSQLLLFFHIKINELGLDLVLRNVKKKCKKHEYYGKMGKILVSQGILFVRMKPELIEID